MTGSFSSPQLLLCLLLCPFLPCVLGQPAPSSSTQCDVSRSNQQINDRGALYWCGGDGRKVPLACVTPDGQRIDIGLTAWTDSTVLECRQVSTDSLQLSSVACLKNGRRIEPDQSINDGRYFYKCVRGGGSDGGLKLQSTGCVGAPGGQPVPPGGTVNQDGFVYTCDVGSSGAAGGGPAPRPSPAQPGAPAPQAAPSPQQGAQLTPVGCSFNGKDYKLGDDMELSGAWYKCTKDSSGTPTSVPMGCSVNGTKYKLGQTWRDEFFALKCEQLAGSYITGHAYACVERYPDGRVAEYAPGRKWLVGSNPYNQYVIACTQQGIQLRRRGIACYYTVAEGQGVLDGGCMKKVGGIMIQCAAPGATPNVRIRITENPSAADEQRLQASGYRFCESKPVQSVIN